jgi:MoxR-like ATPase
MKQLKTRMKEILSSLNKDMYERENIFSVSLLSALCEQNIFLYGPPGTAKSLISRRLAKVFDTKEYFEYLMQKFSTPEEVFGPISLTELKKDNYVRKIDNYLPTSEFAFLDEIWKSSPAILNTLLTLINEKKFRNGKELLDIPLKVLISASNETPPSGQGLEALYDRFTTRLYVPPMQSREKFELLLQNGGSIDGIEIDEKLLIKTDEWKVWKEEIQKVKISQEVFTIVNAIRLVFEKESKKKSFDVYVSDRRWQKALTLVKAGAFFCERSETNIVDALLLSNTLWTTKENREKVIEIVEDAVRECGFETGYSLKSLDDEKEKLELEINNELFYSNDVYDTVNLDGNTQYFEVQKIIQERYSNSEKIKLFIPKKMMKTTDKFHPIDNNGNEIKWIRCSFKKQGSCDIEYNEEGRDDSYYLNKSHCWKNLESYSPKIFFYKGDKKEDINERLVEALKEETKSLSEKIEKLIQDTETKKEKFLEELDTPFVQAEKIAIAIESVEKQIDELTLRHKDTQRLSDLVG